MSAVTELHSRNLHQSQVEAFQQDIRNTCGGFNVVPQTGATRMLGAVKVRERNGLHFARIDIGPSSVQRSREDIRRSAVDPYFLILQTQGRAEMCHADSVTSLERGDIFVVDSARSSGFRFVDAHNQQISFRLPRAEVHQRFGKMLTGGLCISHKDRGALALRSAICAAISDEAAKVQGEDVFGLLGSFLRCLHTGHDDHKAPDGLLLSAALGVISAEFRDPDFTPADLSDRLGVPMRKLQRAFNRVGMTPRKAILHTRLRNAHALLPLVRTPHGARSYTELAFSQGFGDLSYFYREFRKRYGFAPGKQNRFSTSELELMG